ncbi:MAG: hypothetical protein BAJALOKI1v1_130021 [Promethearchaeota archaeon]|nr:MAG: hypothetical protein BAJALOKI1v1_130021 [Candidatus Lokiarchaeota archaeon]
MIGENQLKLPKDLQEKEYLKTAGGKKKACSVKECEREAVRSLSEEKWEGYLRLAELDYVENRKKKIFLCKKHYNAAKKVKKEDDKYNLKKGFLQDSRQGGRDRF